MKRHFIEINTDELSAVWISDEYATILDYLRNEKKTLCLLYEEELKIIEDDEIFEQTKIKSLWGKTTIVLDRNILISARDIYKSGRIFTERHKFFCALAYYGMSIDCLFDPTIPLYEGGDRYQQQAVEDMRMFSVMDNLESHIVMDLLFEVIEIIPKIAWQTAKENTPEIDFEEQNENYNKELTFFKYSYPYMIKVAQILRMKGVNRKKRVEILLDWALNNYFIKSEALFVSLFCIAKNGGVLKNHGSANYAELIASIKNASWDITLLSYLKSQAKKHIGQHQLLVTEDRKLIEASREFFNGEDGFINLFDKQGNLIFKMIKEMNAKASDESRLELVKDRINNIGHITSTLETELRNSFSN